MTDFTIASFNVKNLIGPDQEYYEFQSYTPEEFAWKEDWMADQLLSMDADIIGFQEVFEEAPLRELVREICRSNDIEILRGHVSRDHVHLLLSVPPHLAPSRVMQAIKGKSSHHLLRNFRVLQKEFWGRHLWARGYFVASSGNVTDEVLAHYIAHQDVEPQDDAFGINE